MELDLDVIRGRIQYIADVQRVVAKQHGTNEETK